MISLEEFKTIIKSDSDLLERYKNRLREKYTDYETEVICSNQLNISKFQDPEFARWCSDHNVKWQDSNFFISDNVGVLSNCCRLLSDTAKLDGFINSIGGTALSIGSCRVSTINLVRIAYESKYNKKRYLEILKDRVTLDCKALYSMRSILKRNIEKGLLPNYCDGGLELSKQYCTVGILGLYEVMDLFGLINTDVLGYKSYSDEAVEFAKEIFAIINDIKDNFTTEFTFNVESIPAENCAGTICTADNLLFRDNGEDYSTTWYTIEYEGIKYKLNNKSTVVVNIGNRKKEVSLQEAIDSNYDIDQESLERFRLS